MTGAYLALGTSEFDFTRARSVEGIEVMVPVLPTPVEEILGDVKGDGNFVVVKRVKKLSN